MRIGFLTGTEEWLRKQQLAAKHLRMRLEGLVYPDVFSLPYFFVKTFDFIREGERIPKGRYDLLLAELQGSDSQLKYLESVVSAGDPTVAVIPGPPEILSRNLTNNKLIMVKNILVGARYIWAYSDAVRGFCDGLIGRRKSVVIPWPFDRVTTRRIARLDRKDRRIGHRILIQVPLRFSGIAQNHPFVLKGVLMEAWNDLPDAIKGKVTFHTFVYAKEDKEKYWSSGFPEGLPMHLEEKMGYVSFVRFVAGCAGVVNLTMGNILGRVTFLSAALDKPGIFSDNTGINRNLYPDSVVSPFDTERLRDLLGRLFAGLADGSPDGQLLPSGKSVVEIGNFPANSESMNKLLAADRVCVES